MTQSNNNKPGAPIPPWAAGAICSLVFVLAGYGAIRLGERSYAAYYAGEYGEGFLFIIAIVVEALAAGIFINAIWTRRVK